MKFLCDVHISFKLVKLIESKSFDCVHVNYILEKWYTKDSDIAEYVDANDFILISKDSDFKNSHYIKKSPKKTSQNKSGQYFKCPFTEYFFFYFARVGKS